MTKQSGRSNLDELRKYVRKANSKSLKYEYVVHAFCIVKKHNIPCISYFLNLNYIIFVFDYLLFI